MPSALTPEVVIRQPLHDVCVRARALMLVWQESKLPADTGTVRHLIGVVQASKNINCRSENKLTHSALILNALI